MSSVSALLGQVVVDQLWQGALLIAVITLLARWRSAESAATHHALWLLGLIALVAMPIVLMVPLGDDELGDKAIQIVNRIVIQSNADSTTIVDSASSSDMEFEAPVFEMDLPEAPPRTPAWTPWVAGAAGIVAAWQLLLLGQAQRRVRLLRRQAQPAPTSTQALGDAIADQFELRRAPPILWSDDIDSPQTNGTLRPAILLPARWMGHVGDEVLEHALAHELAHLKRADHWVVWLQFGARVLFGLNPAVWYVIARINQEREAACDDWALRLGARPKAYASSLVTVAESLVKASGRESALAVSCLRSRDHLRRRVTQMLDGRRNHSTGSLRPVVWLIAALVVAGSAVAAPNWRSLGPALVNGVMNAGQEAGRSLRDGSRDWGRSLRDGSRSWGRDRGPRPEDGVLYAAWNGDVQGVSVMLDKGIDPDQVFDRDPRTALIAAARGQHWDVVRLLVDRGADVKFHARGDESPLMAVARGSQADLVARFIELGADPDEVVSGDGTPLIAAARGGDLESARVLLLAGADPERFVSGDEAPLYHAVIRGHDDIVVELLAAGADPNVDYRGDGTPLMLAIQHGHENVAQTLLSAGAEAGIASPGDGTALIEAARRDDTRLIESLIAAGADVDQAVLGDGTALINAAARGHFEATEALLQSGADVNLGVSGDDTPLINAVRSDNPEVVRLLLDRGADPNQSGDFDRRLDAQRTPLNQASDREVVSLLVAAGAAE